MNAFNARSAGRLVIESFARDQKIYLVGGGIQDAIGLVREKMEKGMIFYHATPRRIMDWRHAIVPITHAEQALLISPLLIREPDLRAWIKAHPYPCVKYLSRKGLVVHMPTVPRKA